MGDARNQSTAAGDRSNHWCKLLVSGYAPTRILHDNFPAMKQLCYPGGAVAQNPLSRTKAPIFKALRAKKSGLGTRAL